MRKGSVVAAHHGGAVTVVLMLELTVTVAHMMVNLRGRHGCWWLGRGVMGRE